MPPTAEGEPPLADPPLLDVLPLADPPLLEVLPLAELPPAAL
jgi:hypothetical protein